jgi:hypothetical protein
MRHSLFHVSHPPPPPEIATIQFEASSGAMNYEAVILDESAQWFVLHTAPAHAITPQLMG